MAKTTYDPNQSLTLYHFTNLFNLPEILSEGITKGEVPIGSVPYSERPQAANLTQNANPAEQSCWVGNNLIVAATDKTRVRLTVTVPRGSISTFKRIGKQYHLSRQWVKCLAPADEYLDWYFAFDGVRPEQIDTVEVALVYPREYTEMGSERLTALVKAIEGERERMAMSRRGQMLRCANGFTGTFLLDGEAALRQNKYPVHPMKTDLYSVLFPTPKQDKGVQLLESIGSAEVG